MQCEWSDEKNKIHNESNFGWENALLNLEKKKTAAARNEQWII